MDWLRILQIIIAVALMAVILLQNRGAGLSGIFGGGGNIYSAKRGLDKILFKATIVMVFLFFGISFLSILL